MIKPMDIATAMHVFKISQKKVAEASGVSTAAVSKFFAEELNSNKINNAALQLLHEAISREMTASKMR